MDVFLQSRRDGRAAKRFFKRLLQASDNEPRRVVTDKLRSYCVAHRELMPDTVVVHTRKKARTEKLICQYHAHRGTVSAVFGRSTMRQCAPPDIQVW